MVRILFFILTLILPVSAYAACASPTGNAGDIIYNVDHKVVQFCDDTNWVSMAGGGGVGGSCSSTSLDDTTLPSGTVTGGGVGPANAFNNNTSDYWSLTQGQAVTYDFGAGSGATVNKISMIPDVRSTSFPGTFTLAGSNDAASWATLTTQTSICGGWATGVKRTFTFTNTVQYRFYRVTVSANCGHGAGDVEIREIELGGLPYCPGGGGGGSGGGGSSGPEVSFAAIDTTSALYATWGEVGFTTEVFDNGGGFSGNKFTAPSAGTYAFHATISYANGNAIGIIIQPEHASVNPNRLCYSTGSGYSASCSGVANLNAGDVVEVIGWSPITFGLNGANFSGYKIASGGGSDNLGNHIATKVLAMGNFKITGLATPTASTDAANKGYVDTMVPSGAVMAFDLTSCPTGWSEYTAARGRFLRGIDPSGSTTVDPDGIRAPGNQQADMFQGHKHQYTTPQNYDDLVGGSGTSARIASTGTTGVIVTDGTNGTPRIGKETRPVNVAVLFCRKD